jgi:hypothetical protein
MVHRIDGEPRRKRSSSWMWLLLIPYPAVLWVPFYNMVEPRILGFPFFYAYQMAFVVITAVLTAFVYFVTD